MHPIAFLALALLSANTAAGSEKFGKWAVSIDIDPITDDVSTLLLSSPGEKGNSIGFECFKGEKQYTIRSNRIFSAKNTNANIDFRIDKREPGSVAGSLPTYKKIAFTDFTQAQIFLLVHQMKRGNHLYIKARSTYSDGYLADKISLQGFSKAYKRWSSVCTVK
ncbi:MULTISPECIES: hypothetical protein [Thiomicrorhabdus]|uniref:NADH:ubiquinone oxidoreductase intermediate-associated protein 30 domain-containing protein n=1 Tax=Thiomicrorhabdus heinhorstiae TaxID=2748010 RepID=A0ABS0BXY6_9GAMM|nr:MULTISPECIES: hypothetical protein [Thiomicrorhabdus]MBF6057869.1 hypothetical protein [Thiomicrorhabdus heinhorstiae]